MTTLLLLALLGVIISIIIGTLWHAPFSPMGRIHMRYLGFDKLSPEEQKQKIEEAKPGMYKTYIGQMILSMLTSSLVVFIVAMSLVNGMSFTMALGFIYINWLCFIVPTVGGNILWGNCEKSIAWKKFFADIGYSFVTLGVVAYVTSLFM